jgi:glutamate racemase
MMYLHNAAQEGFVGVYDSGLGGLSVWQAVRSLLPQEHLVYFADSLYAPYGDRDSEWIAERVIAVVSELMQRGAKAVVLACNTATSVVLEELRRVCDIPIIAIEPGVKVAASLTRSKSIGVIATTATLSSSRYRSLLAQYAQNVEVISQPCPGLVEFIERDHIHSDRFRQLLASYIQPLIKKGIDQLVLGCTHYAFIKPQIAAIAGVQESNQIGLVDPVDAVALQVQRRLQALGLIREAASPGINICLSTGSIALAKQFIQSRLDVPWRFTYQQVSLSDHLVDMNTEHH